MHYQGTLDGKASANLFTDAFPSCLSTDIFFYDAFLTTFPLKTIDYYVLSWYTCLHIEIDSVDVKDYW